MFVLPYVVIQDVMRRSLVGAMATDPVIADHPRPQRRRIRARLAQAGPRLLRTAATARQSS
jgi:hypothetical protein